MLKSLMSYHYTQKKFSSFSRKKQHALSLKFLKILREHTGDISSYLDEYNRWQTWMNTPLLTTDCSSALSDHYHFHHREKEGSLSDAHLLPNIRKNDRPFSFPPFPITIFLDRLRSAHNVGSIIRTTEAFSLGSILFSETTPFADHPQVRKTAMGTESWVSCQKIKTVEELQGPIIALETSDQANSLFSYFFPKKFTLALGNEEEGCSKEILQKADVVLNIPLRGKKNSLNVANAFAIAAFEIVKQRMEKK